MVRFQHFLFLQAGYERHLVCVCLCVVCIPGGSSVYVHTFWSVAFRPNMGSTSVSLHLCVVGVAVVVDAVPSKI